MRFLPLLIFTLSTVLAAPSNGPSLGMYSSGPPSYPSMVSSQYNGPPTGSSALDDSPNDFFSPIASNPQITSTTPPSSDTSVSSTDNTITISGSSYTYTNHMATSLRNPYDLYWTVQSDDSVQFFVVAKPPNQGYAAIGFNPNLSMVGSRAVVACQPSGSSQSTVTEYYLSSKSPSGVNPATTPIITDTAVEYGEDGYVRFTFVVPAGLESALNVNSEEGSGLIYAVGNPPHGSSKISYHTETGSAIVYLS